MANDIKDDLVKILNGNYAFTTDLDILQVISLVALIKKYFPDETVSILNKVDTQKELQYLIEKLKNALGIKNSFILPSIINEKLLDDCLELVKNVDSFLELTLCIRNYLQSISASLKENYPSLNETKLFHAIIEKKQYRSVYDGIAGMSGLVHQINYEKAYLQEENDRYWQIGYCLLLLENKTVEFYQSNSLEQPQFSQEGVDIVVMTIPFGQRIKPDMRQKIKEQKYLLDKTMSIPSSASDSLWLQLALYSLNDKGKAYVMLSSGWLFRGGYDEEIRKSLINSGVIEAIIQLPNGFMTGSFTNPILIVLNKARKKAEEYSIKLVDATDLLNVNARNELSNEKAIYIAELLEGKHSTDEHYKVILLSNIKENNYVLSVDRYINTKEVTYEKLDFLKEYEELLLAQHQYEQVQDKLNELLSKFK